MSTQAQSGGSSGFFSDIVSGFGQGLKETLPRWTEKQLGMQSKNQLNQDTINKSLQPISLHDKTITVVKNIPVTTWIALGVGILLVVYVVKKS